MEWVAGLIGVVVGAAVTVGVACLERRWRGEDVRAAEKRVRLEERLKPVRDYAAALCEFVYDASNSMAASKLSKPDKGRSVFAEPIFSQVEGLWEKAQERRPWPAPRFTVRDKLVHDHLQTLEILAYQYRFKCGEWLQSGSDPTESELQGWLANAEKSYQELLDRMEMMLQGS